MAKKMLNGCAVVLATFVIPFLIILFAGGSYLVSGFSEEGSEVEIEVRGPQYVVLRQPFYIDVLVTNHATYVQTLDDIDFNPKILEAVEVVEATPAFSRTTTDLLFATYWFEQEIGPGDTLTVSLEMIGREAGAHPFRMGICINQPTNCMNYESTLVVTE